MKLWIWSDLHLEMQNPTFVDTPPEADVIVCAGDLCHADTLGDHARRLIERYGLPMVFVPGNHEFHINQKIGSPRTKPSDHLPMKEVAEASRSWRQRLYVLDDGPLELGGVRFVGGTLWTDFMMDIKDEADFPWRMQEASSQLEDFSKIWLDSDAWLTPQDMLDFHTLTRAFIEHQLATPFDGTTVVVTHHLPHPDCTPAACRDRDTSYLFACGKGAFEGILNSDAAPPDLRSHASSKRRQGRPDADRVQPDGPPQGRQRARQWLSVGPRNGHGGPAAMTPSAVSKPDPLQFRTLAAISPETVAPCRLQFDAP